MHTTIMVAWEPEGWILWGDMSENTLAMPSFGNRRSHSVRRGMLALTCNTSLWRPSSTTEFQASIGYMRPCLKHTGWKLHKREKARGKECHIWAKFSLYSYIISHNLCLVGMVILLCSLGSWVRAGQVIRVQEKYSANCKQAMIWGGGGSLPKIQCSKSSWFQTLCDCQVLHSRRAQTSPGQSCSKG